ncbi:MAG TPA: RsmE family RNA methyltransferase [Candidatus Bathyarchaeia archaeon]|nr:RsmE family RNA methyltransferase [Candidatus Bathyarchaeia archaeon]
MFGYDAQRRRGAGRPALGRYDAPGDAPLTVPSLELEVPFVFDGALARRLARREVNPKEAFTVRNDAGVYFRASLKELGADGGEAVPYERMPRSPEPAVEITLACAVLARQRMIFVVQKATELGVSRIVPLLTEYAVPRHGLEHEKAHAWPGQVIRAAKQCRRSSLPELLAPVPLAAFLGSPAAGADLSLFLDDRSSGTPAPAATPRRIILFVGPEGGFSDAERDVLKSRAVPWVLGGRVLRAETAVLAGLTAVQLAWGDFHEDGG